MTGLPILLSRQKGVFIPIEANDQLIANYFRSTTRGIHALFDQRGLEELGNGSYRYVARPIPIVWWEVVPRLLFHVEQAPAFGHHDFDLKLVLDACQLSGDEGWSVVADNLTFDCQASFSSSICGFQAIASAAASVNRSGWLRFVPATVIHELATPVIEWVLGRLLMRCEKSMREDLKCWLQQSTVTLSC